MSNCLALLLFPSAAIRNIFDNVWIYTDLGVQQNIIRDHFINFQTLARSLDNLIYGSCFLSSVSCGFLLRSNHTLVGYATISVPSLPQNILLVGQIVGQKFCGCVADCDSLLVACRVPYHTKETEQQEYQSDISIFNALCKCFPQQWSPTVRCGEQSYVLSKAWVAWVFPFDFPNGPYYFCPSPYSLPFSLNPPIPFPPHLSIAIFSIPFSIPLLPLVSYSIPNSCFHVDFNMLIKDLKANIHIQTKIYTVFVFF